MPMTWEADLSNLRRDFSRKGLVEFFRRHLRSVSGAKMVPFGAPSKAIVLAEVEDLIVENLGFPSFRRFESIVESRLIPTGRGFVAGGERMEQRRFDSAAAFKDLELWLLPSPRFGRGRLVCR